jgi:hypothetical protein
MAATALLSALANHLASVLTAPVPPIGPVQPAADEDLPAVAVSLEDVEPTLVAIGRTPAAVRTGALRVDTSIDLADPVLRLPGETVTLLSPDRRLLQLPHGGVVRADGGDQPPFGPTDVVITRGGTTFTPVGVDPVTGAVTFGEALPPTGTLALRYFVGTWEAAVERHAGLLTLDAYAATAADALSLSDRLVDALGRGAGVPGLHRLDLTAAGPVVPAGFGTARRRSLTYRFDFEREVATVQTSGGPIRSVVADVETDTETESFTVTREGDDA